MVRFTPYVWKGEGDKVNTAADTFYRGAHKVIVAEKLTTTRPVDGGLMPSSSAVSTTSCANRALTAFD